MAEPVERWEHVVPTGVEDGVAMEAVHRVTIHGGPGDLVAVRVEDMRTLLQRAGYEPVPAAPGDGS